MNRDKRGREIERVTDITITVRGHYGIDVWKPQLLAILEARREWFLETPSPMVVRKSMDPQSKLADLAAARLTYLFDGTTLRTNSAASPT